jgi:undecaprenyl-diphosphatase
MTVVQAIILGLVQGITEFLPISSSGFLILIPEFFGWEVQSLAFDAFLHLATLSAVVCALWPDVRQLKPSSTTKLFGWIVLATIPVLFIGFLTQQVFGIEFRSVRVVGWSFVVWGVVLYLVDRFARHRDVSIENVGIKRSVLIGLAQIIALIPGTSRSGITITAGLASGLTREVATKFSFLLGIPTIAAAGLLKVFQVLQGADSVAWIPMMIGFLTAFFTAFLTIKFLLAFIQKHSFSELAIFRVILGVFILLL